MRARMLVGRLVVVFMAMGAVLGCAAVPRAVDGPPFVYERFAVATDHPVASAAGAEMLRLGGNAVDAAVAASFTLSVVRPYSCGLGGGGFMVIHASNEQGRRPAAVALNYRETAPAAITSETYEQHEDDEASRFGGLAVGVPGTAIGLLHALERYGTLDRAVVLAPAIRAAQEGFAADEDFVRAARELKRELDRRPERRRFIEYHFTHVCREGHLRVGERITNPRQAEALRLIARDGAAAVRVGAIGRAIVRSAREAGGILTLDDLSGYTLDEGEPLRGSFGDYDLITMPPPSSGGIALLQTLTMLEARKESTAGRAADDPLALHLLAECLKHAFADRARHLADTNFVPVPIDQLLDDEALRRRAWAISLAKTSAVATYGVIAPPPDDGGTSHLSVIDGWGMAVACTETINLSFGSLVEVAEFGFLLNNEMDDFTTKRGAANAFGLRQSDDNLPAPGKRPLSSMTPTIVLHGGEPVLVAGASGGPRIITATVQVILRVLRDDFGAHRAVEAPRMHHQWLPDRLLLEAGLLSDERRAALEERGHKVEPIENVGVVQIVRRRPDGRLEAASDPRKGGRPDGE